MAARFYTIATAEDVQNQYTAELCRNGDKYDVFLENPEDGNAVRRFNFSGDAVLTFAKLAAAFGDGNCDWAKCMHILMGEGYKLAHMGGEETDTADGMF